MLRWTLPLLFALALLPLVPAPAGATDYTFRDGFYWSGKTPHVRTWVWDPVSYYQSYGYWYAKPRTGYYKYTAVPVAYRKAAAVADWRQAFTAIARQRSEDEQMVKAFGALGIAPPAGLASSAYTTGYGSALVAQGQTSYGLSLRQVQDYYATTDPMILYQQAARLTQGAQQLAGEANTGFQGLVSQAGANAARIAEIRERGIAAATVFRATEPQPSSTTTVVSGGSSTGSTTTTAPTTPGSAPVGPITPVDPGTPASPDTGSTGVARPREDSALAPASVREADRAFLRDVGMPACGACHSGKNIKGGFDVAAFPSMTTAQKKKVWARLITDDPRLVMPRKPDGGPGSLPAAHLRAFLRR